MNHKRNFIVALLVGCACAQAAQAAEIKIGPYGYGFRGDGSGVYPDSKPPLHGDDKSRKIREVFNTDGEKVGENILTACPFEENQKDRFLAQGFEPTEFSYSGGSPNIGGNYIYLCSQSHLYCISEGGK
jgi:hypothetical protein